MKAGDRIRIFTYTMGRRTGTKDLTVEEFRDCLGVFENAMCKEAGHFTPLCDLYEPGVESEERYVSNFGAYDTNMVQTWMDI